MPLRLLEENRQMTEMRQSSTDIEEKPNGLPDGSQGTVTPTRAGTDTPDVGPYNEVNERGDGLDTLEHRKTQVSYSYEDLRGWRRWRVLRPGRGMYHDVKRRLPFYWSDITDAWTYRTFASVLRMYFVKYVLPLYLSIDTSHPYFGDRSVPDVELTICP